MNASGHHSFRIPCSKRWTSRQRISARHFSLDRLPYPGPLILEVPQVRSLTVADSVLQVPVRVSITFSGKPGELDPPCTVPSSSRPKNAGGCGCWQSRLFSQRNARYRESASLLISSPHRHVPKRISQRQLCNRTRLASPPLSGKLATTAPDWLSWLALQGALSLACPILERR